MYIVSIDRDEAQTNTIWTVVLPEKENVRLDA